MAKPIIYGNRKKGIQAGGTLDSAGNISIGGKDPTSPTGLSGTRNQATGYNPAKDPNYRAPSGRNKDISTIKAPKKGPTTGGPVKPSWATAGHEYVNGKWIYTAPLSAQGQANVASSVARANAPTMDLRSANYPNAVAGRNQALYGATGGALGASNFGLGQPGNRSVGGGFGGGSGGAWGPASTLPGQSGNIISRGWDAYSNFINKTIGDPLINEPAANVANYIKNPGAPRGVGETFGLAGDIAGFLPLAGAFGKGAAWTAKSLYGGAKGLASLVGKYGLKEGTSIFNRLRKGGTAAETAVSRLVSKGDDVATQATKPLQRVPQIPVSAPVRASTATTRLTGAASKLGSLVRPTTTTRKVIAGALGAVAATGAIGGVVSTTPGVARNSTSATKASTTQTTQRTADASVTEPAIAGLSSPLGGGTYSSSVAGGGNVSGGAGMTSGTSLRGENLSPQQAAAQARAQELARSQVDQQGITTAPFGEAVDVASLQTLRDRTKQLLDAGITNETMPEFKANMQALLASGLENMRKLQPTPPVPIVDTPEIIEMVSNAPQDQQRQIMEELDALRESYGGPDLERERADLKLQLNTINDIYEKAIDQIKENPNLPKGLAARRLTEVFEDQKFALSETLARLENVEDQIDTMNNAVMNARQDLALQLQYDQFAASQEDKYYQRKMDQLGVLIQGRAIGGMSDSELNQWAQVTGISYGALNKLRQNAMDMDNEKIVDFEKIGDSLVQITYDKKDPTKKTVEVIGSAPSGGGGVGQYTKDQLGILNTISDNARQQPEIKNFPNIRESYEAAVNARGQGKGAGDIVLMRMIAKITDPTTGVREEEFRTFESAQSTLSRYGVNLSKRWWSGDRLTEEGRDALLQVAQDRYAKAEAGYTQAINFYQNQAAQFGVPAGTPIIPSITTFAQDNYGENAEFDTEDSAMFSEITGTEDTGDVGWWKRFTNYLSEW